MPFESHACEYANGSDLDCATFALCDTTGHWHVDPPDASCGMNPPSCPPTSAEVTQGVACPMVDAATCAYPDAVCACTSCQAGSGLGSGGIMTCRPRNDVAAGCPMPRPLLGTPCTSEGLFCDYAAAIGEVQCKAPLGPSMSCYHGYWEYVGPGEDGGCGLPACPQ